jgi:hypothetical protein
MICLISKNWGDGSTVVVNLLAERLFLTVWLSFVVGRIYRGDSVLWLGDNIFFGSNMDELCNPIKTLKEELFLLTMFRTRNDMGGGI